MGEGRIHGKHEYFCREAHSSFMGIQFDFDNKESREKIVPEKKKKARKFIWEVIIVIVVGVLSGGVGICSVMIVNTTRRRPIKERVNLTSLNSVFQRGAGPTRCS